MDRIKEDSGESQTNYNQDTEKMHYLKKKIIMTLTNGSDHTSNNGKVEPSTFRNPDIALTDQSTFSNH